MARDIAGTLLPGQATPPIALGLPRGWSGRWQRLRVWAAPRAEALTTWAVLTVAFAHLLRVYDRGLNLLDEGFVLHVAERVLQGQVPYRDFFTQLTPGAFLALAAVFKVTGPSILVGRWVTVALGLLITWLLFWGARRIASRPVAAVAALMFPVWGIGQGWFYPNYSWFALAASVGALCCLLRAYERWERPPPARAAAVASRVPARAAVGWLVAAGLLCGLAAFCKQNMGLYTLLALVAAVVLAGPPSWRARVAAGAVMAAASAPIPLALVAWLAANGALADFYRDAVWIPLVVFPREMAAPYPPFWPPWPLPADQPGQGAWAFRLVCLLPPLPYALAVVNLCVSMALHRGAPASAHRAVHAAWLLFGMAIWATAFPRADFDHVQVALGPAFVVGAAMMESAGRLAVRRRVWRLWRAPERRLPRAGSRLTLPDGAWCRRWLPQTLACALLACFLLAGIRHARLLHMGPTWTLRTLEAVAPRAAGIRLDYDEAAELRHLIPEVRRLSAPGEAIAVLPWNAGLYFLAERGNVTRFDLFIPASVLPDDMPEIQRSLERADLIVYWTPRDPFVNNTSLDDRLPELHAFIMSRYQAVAAVNAYRLLRKV